MAKAKAKPKAETILKLSDLAEWQRNPRTITDEAMAGLGKSIESFGDVSGITWNKRLGALVAGHQRVKQLREHANGQEVPIQMLSPELGIMVVAGKAFSVRIVDWDEATHAAAAIAANSRHIAGEWVDADLSALLGEVQELTPDMFGELRFDVLAAEFPMPEEVVAPESFPEVGEDLETEHTCPKCGYKWSGGNAT